MNEELVFESSRTKSIAWALAFLFGAYFISLAIPEMPILGWLFTIAFGFGAIGLFANSLTKYIRIVATRDEVVLYGPHKPIKYKLEELSAFHMSELKTLEFIVISYNSAHTNKTLSSRVLCGTDRFIGNFYKLPLEDICEALNTRLQNFNVMQSNKSFKG